MLGAIIGDICGSVYEWHNEKDINRIELFKKGCHPTDDSVMTVAVAQALIDSKGKRDRTKQEVIINSMHYYGRLFPNAGYGGNFGEWLDRYERDSYNSWGNGSGMRVASVGWLYDSYEKTMHVAKLTSEVTHNHPEGVKGAQAIASAIYMARIGMTKEKIREVTERNFYELNFTLDQIRPDYRFDVSSQGSCPHAIEAFLESDSFEDAIKKAISIGGDSDTIAAMTGSIAEAYYGIPDEMKDKAYKVLEFVNGNNTVYNNVILRDAVERFTKYMVKRIHIIQENDGSNVDK